MAGTFGATFARSVVVTVTLASAISTQPLSARRMTGQPDLRIRAIATTHGSNVTIAPGDFDGDGRVDISVKHNTNDTSPRFGEWTIDFAANGFGLWDQTYGGFGNADYVAAPADYDGDGQTDLSTKDIWGTWYIDYASNGLGEWDAFYHLTGTAGAHPVPRDYDGDGRADLSVKTDGGNWYIDYAANGFGTWDWGTYGLGGALVEAVPADYDGDGKADLSVRDSSGNWLIDYSRNGYRAPGFWEAGSENTGAAGGHPVPADYDGDGKADLAIKTDAGQWLIDFAAGGYGEWNVTLGGVFGPSSFRPMPADYDGDGRADLAARADAGHIYHDLASNGYGQWNRKWNPEVVTLSGGRTVTQRDRDWFDSRWMSHAQRGYFSAWMGITFGGFEGGVWAIGDRLNAMTYMYDLTQAPQYLQHLSESVAIVLANRDDRHGRDVITYDGIRGRVMPAWGVSRISYGGYHHASLDVAGVYSYPIAAFARIVAENPALHAQYGVQAKEAVKAVVETLDAFLPELRTQSGAGGRESFFANPPAYRTLLTASRCEWAYQDQIAQDIAEGLESDLEAYAAERHQCNNNRDIGGKAFAHNGTQAMVMAFIELSRALDTELYKVGLTAVQRLSAETMARKTIPLIVAQSQRYFVNRFYLRTTSAGEYFVWDHVDIDSINGEDTRKLDDTGHYALSMRYFGLLVRDTDRLDGFLLASPEGAEWIRFGPDHVTPIGLHPTRLANTFRLVVGKGTNLKESLKGESSDPIDKRNGDCDGPLNLAQFNARVYSKCAQITLRVVADYQRYLIPNNHAALLKNKRYR